MKIITLNKIQFLLYPILVLLFLSSYGYAAHWEDPEGTTSAVHLIGTEFAFNGIDAEIGDEVAIFNSEDQLIGHFTVNKAGQYGDMPIWIYNIQTPEIASCSPGSDLSICVWDQSADMEYCDNDVDLLIPQAPYLKYDPPAYLPLTCTATKMYLLNISISDADNDGIIDDEDNCVNTPNADQTDDDNDEFGAACDCNDNDDTVYTIENEGPDISDATCQDGIDNDCDGTIDGADTDCPIIPPPNNPPLIPELVFPADDQTDLGDIVEFEWKETTDPDGDTVTYDLIVCTDENFTEGCVTLADIASLNKDKIYFAGSGIGLLLFGVVLAGDIRGNKRKMLLLLAMIIIIAVYSAACGSGGGGGGETSPPPIDKVTVTGTVLDKNGNAIEGAEVTISSDPQTVTTDSSGNFTAEVEVGNHEIEIMNGSKEIYSSTFSCDANFSLGDIDTCCGSRPVPDDIVIQEVGVTIGTTYYWKVVATDSNGAQTESEVRSFTTAS